MEAQSSTAQSPSSLDQEEMNVYLKIVKTIPMKVKRTDAIGTLKAKINQKEGISEITQKLFFNGKPLSNVQTMADSGVQNYSTLHLFANNDAISKIFIKIPSNNSIIEFEVKSNETVRNIKLMVQEKEGIRPNTFTLLYNGNVLEDDTVLSLIGVTNDSIIHLIFSEKEILITITVKAPGKEAVKLSVKSIFSVRDVKAIALDMLGIEDRMFLFYDEKVLKDSETLDFYGVKDGSGLDLLTAEQVEIFVEDFTRNKITLSVRLSDHVDYIMYIVEKKLGIREDDKFGLFL